MIGELNSNECDNNGLWEVVFDVRKHRMEADYRRVRAETAVEEPALACRAASARDRRCVDGLG